MKAIARRAFSILVGLAPVLAAAAPVAVVEPHQGAPLERLAAREIRRYLYLRTGLLPTLTNALPLAGQAVVILPKASPLGQTLLEPPDRTAAAALKPQEFLLRMARSRRDYTVCIAGGDAAGVLYGAYRYCEWLGVRFYLHGDVVPDDPLTGNLPDAHENGRPLFELRGILPFHDFPEGPDWWNRDDYLAYLDQLARLRMNFIGLHCYPEGHPHAEPLVWIGPPSELDAGGRIKAAYPSFWAATWRRGAWGYAPMATSEFTGGADRLFHADYYAHEVFAEMPDGPRTREQCDEVFHRAGAFFQEVFGYARQLGIKTCIGTETPLTIPDPVALRLMQAGRNPDDPAVTRELYEGIFRRIRAVYPVDYYWLWTPERWTWEGNHPEEFRATVRDIQAALQALETLRNPFQLATAGWVLGPANDRLALDAVLPTNVPMSCINREVGHDLVEAGFAKLRGRPKWAIPWLENDPNLAGPQLWAGRMRYDATDALRLGCTGLLGIHWRTRILAPNIAALAGAAWDQSYTPANWNVRVPSRGRGPLGGDSYHSRHPVAGTDESIIYQSVRYDCEGYELDLPNGLYQVRLQFNEPQFREGGHRIFGVKVQDRVVEDQLDIAARVGWHRALDITCRDVRVEDGCLRIAFLRITNVPCIAAITIEGRSTNGASLTRKVNCGGELINHYERDGVNDKPGTVERRRTMPIRDFYVDFARANFGAAVAEAAGELLTRHDGMNFPQPSHWADGPGGVTPVKPRLEDYRFVDDFEALRDRVRGPANLERFDYWLNTFRYTRALAEVGGLRADLDRCIGSLVLEQNPAKRLALGEEALQLRIRMARGWERMMSLLAAATDTPGELGTVANLEQHTRRRNNFLAFYDQALASFLGKPIPDDATPRRSYQGPPRLIVPTVRSLARPGEALRIRVIALDQTPVTGLALHWRPMGGGSFQTLQPQHLGRSTWLFVLPLAGEDLEYYITARTARDAELKWPAAAPRLCQTVVARPSP